MWWWVGWLVGRLVRSVDYSDELQLLVDELGRSDDLVSCQIRIDRCRWLYRSTSNPKVREAVKVPERPTSNSRLVEWRSFETLVKKF